MTDIPAATERRWRLWSVIAVAVAILIGGGLGFVVIPVVQGAAGGVDAFTAICRAIGILPGSPARPTPPSEAAPFPVTQVAWTDATIGEIYRADRNTGSALCGKTVLPLCLEELKRRPRQHGRAHQSCHSACARTQRVRD